MIGPTPLLDFFKRGEMARDARLLAARGGLATRAAEQLAILIQLTTDADAEIRDAAEATLSRIPEAPLRAFLARSDTPVELRDFFARRQIHPGDTPAADAEDPLVGAIAGEGSDAANGGAASTAGGDSDTAGAEQNRESITQQIASMGFTDRLKAAVKGSREMRAILIRDPNKMISAAVLSSPKVTDQEVESFAKMTNVSEEVLRIIGANRAWLKNYGVVAGLARNPKTPLALSMNLLNRLNTRDVQMISIDRNVPGTLRIAARKKLVEAATKG
jgi:hypothetical protein